MKGRKGPKPRTRYSLAPQPTPGEWLVWYRDSFGDRGFNGHLHGCFSAEAAIAEQVKRAAIYGWTVEKITVKRGDTWAGPPVAWLRTGPETAAEGKAE